MARRLLGWWWIAAGALVAALIAGALDSTVAWILLTVYVALNLVGTVMLLREVREQAPGRRPNRWVHAIELAFVIQLPIGVIVVVSGGV
jgi:hypothetical protein